MAHHKSALKRIRQTIKRTARNRSERSSLRTSVKKYREVLAGGDQAAAAGEYPEIQKRIDKAVTKGILHARTATRYKSRLTTALNKVLES